MLPNVGGRKVMTRLPSSHEVERARTLAFTYDKPTYDGISNLAEKGFRILNDHRKSRNILNKATRAVSSQETREVYAVAETEFATAILADYAQDPLLRKAAARAIAEVYPHEFAVTYVKQREDGIHAMGFNKWVSKGLMQ